MTAPGFRRADWFDWVAPALACLAVAALLVRPAPAELMQADSETYLGFAAIRTAGYPLFLDFVRWLPGGLTWLPFIQLSLYAISALWFAREFRRLSASPIAGLALLVLLLGNGQVTRLSFMIMTEALFLSSLMALLALLTSLIRRPDWRVLAWGSLFAGLAVLIRPAGYALVAVVPVAALFGWRRGLGVRSSVLAASLPYSAAILAGMTAYHAEHGLWRTQSFLGSNLYGKAAAIVADIPPERRDTDQVWMESVVAPDRTVLDHAPTAFDRFRLIVPYYDVWRWHTLYDPLPARLGLPRGDPAAMDAAMLDLSQKVIAAAPVAYLSDVTLNLAALWCLPDAMTRVEAARFQEFIAGLGPLPDLGAYPARPERSDLAVWAVRGFMLVAFAGSLWWPWRWAVEPEGKARRVALLGTLASLIVHASFLLTAAVQAGMPRYVWAVWPALALLVVLTIAACGDPLRRQKIFRRFVSPSHQ